MSLFDAFRYDGKRVVVIGGATGMGAAAAELAQSAGADVVIMDFAEIERPGVTAIRVNLAERASIDAAVDACGGPVDALFSCAGVADGTAVRWFEERETCNYISTKQAICAYVARQAFPLLKQGIRINAICPGPTDTPLARENKELWLGFGADYREEAGINPFTPMEQAYPLVFLCSDAAAAITGITILADAAWLSSADTGSFAPTQGT